MATLTLSFTNPNLELPLSDLTLYASQGNIDPDSPPPPVGLNYDAATATLAILDRFPNLLPGDAVYIRFLSKLGDEKAWSEQLRYQVWYRNVNLQDRGYLQPQVDQIISDLVTHGDSYGILNLMGCSAPSMTGLGGLDVLAGRNWYITAEHPWWSTNVNLENQGLSAEAVDETLQKLVDNRIVNGTINLRGNDGPSQAGFDNFLILQSRGWESDGFDIPIGPNGAPLTGPDGNIITEYA